MNKEIEFCSKDIGAPDSPVIDLPMPGPVIGNPMPIDPMVTEQRPLKPDNDGGINKPIPFGP